MLSCSVLSDSVTPWTIARQAPLSMGIPQARILEWVAMSSSRGSSQPRDRIQVSYIVGGFFTIWITRETLNAKYRKKCLCQKFRSAGWDLRMEASQCGRLVWEDGVVGYVFALRYKPSKYSLVLFSWVYECPPGLKGCSGGANSPAARISED